jgi:hypothetical protein
MVWCLPVALADPVVCICRSVSFHISLSLTCQPKYLYVRSRQPNSLTTACKVAVSPSQLSRVLSTRAESSVVLVVDLPVRSWEIHHLPSSSQSEPATCTLISTQPPTAKRMPFGAAKRLWCSQLSRVLSSQHSPQQQSACGAEIKPAADVRQERHPTDTSPSLRTPASNVIPDHFTFSLQQNSCRDQASGRRRAGAPCDRHLPLPSHACIQHDSRSC